MVQGQFKKVQYVVSNPQKSNKQRKEIDILKLNIYLFDIQNLPFVNKLNTFNSFQYSRSYPTKPKQKMTTKFQKKICIQNSLRLPKILNKTSLESRPLNH